MLSSQELICLSYRLEPTTKNPYMIASLLSMKHLFVLRVHPNIPPHPKAFIMDPKCSSFLLCDTPFPRISKQFNSRNAIRSQQLGNLLFYFLNVCIEKALITKA